MKYPRHIISNCIVNVIVTRQAVKKVYKNLTNVKKCNELPFEMGLIFLSL